MKLTADILITMAVTALSTLNINAQGITYNHDSSKMNQIMVMETGVGTLTPGGYYSMFHGGYKGTAMATNKQELRSAASLEAWQQVEMAQQFDSAMVKRAKIEVLEIADRNVDAAWAVEGKKIETALNRLERNIQRILNAGGKSPHQQFWQEKVSVFKTAMYAIKRADMPNAKRKQQYLRIYREICDADDSLLRYIALLNAQGTMVMNFNAKNDIPDRRKEIATAAMNRWRMTTMDKQKQNE